MVSNIRVGYGLKKVTISDRGSDPENQQVETRMEEGLKRLDSGDTFILMYSGIDPSGKEWKDEVDVTFGEGAYDYAGNLDIYHKVASFVLLVPKNLLDGIFAGETLAGDTIHRMIQEELQEFRLPWIEPLIAM